MQIFLSEVRLEQEKEYANYLRMTPECFDKLFVFRRAALQNKLLISEMQAHQNMSYFLNFDETKMFQISLLYITFNKFDQINLTVY